MKTLREQNGFTLLEILIVLSIFSVLVMIGSSLAGKSCQIFERERYFIQLKKDIYYAQSFAMDKNIKVNFRFMTTDNYYYANAYQYGTILTSPKVHSIKLKNNGSSPTITFSPNGNIDAPDTVYFTEQNNKESHRLVFQLGRGRFYITKM